jgi:hypothetical protein
VNRSHVALRRGSPYDDAPGTHTTSSGAVGSSYDSRLTLPKLPVPSVRSMMYCPIRGFDLVPELCPECEEADGPPFERPRPPGAGGAGRVAMIRFRRRGSDALVRVRGVHADTRWALGDAIGAMLTTRMKESKSMVVGCIAGERGTGYFPK